MVRAYKVESNGREICYVSSYAVAEQSLRISFSAYTGSKITTTVSSIIVERPGFDPLTYNLIPIDIITAAEHL